MADCFAFRIFWLNTNVWLWVSINHASPLPWECIYVYVSIILCYSLDAAIDLKNELEEQVCVKHHIKLNARITEPCC